MLRHGPVITLALLWGVAVIVGALHPSSDFPLNDDWQYAHVAKQFAETGIFKVDVPVAPTLLAQSALGAGVIQVLGFAHTHLRWLTLGVSALLLCLIVRFHRKVGSDPTWSTLVLLLVVINPIFVQLSQSFMTEIYGVALALWGAYLWLNAGPSRPKEGVAVAVIASSFWVRQYSVLVFPAVWLARLLSLSPTGRWPFLRSTSWQWGLFLVPIIAYFPWARATGNFNPAFGLPFSRLLRPALRELVIHWGVMVAYMSLFFAPILIASMGRLRRASLRSWVQWVLFWIGSVSLAYWAAWKWGDSQYTIRMPLHQTFPFLCNIINPFGLGPITLTETYHGQNPVLPGFTPWAWWVLQGLLLPLSGFWGPLMQRLRDLKGAARETALFGLILSALNLLACVQAYRLDVFDRYHLMGFLGLAVSLPVVLPRIGLASEQRHRSLVFLIFFLPMGLGVIAAQHDYFAWNQARWSLLERAKSQGIEDIEIDGGYELNGWLAFEGKYRRADPVCGERQRWFCMERPYRIALDTGRDTPLLREKVNSWLKNFPDLILTDR